MRSLVTSVDGKGQGRIVLSGSRKGRRASAVFVCDVERGLIEVAGEVEPDGDGAENGSAFDEFAASIGGDLVEGAHALACGLLSGSLLLSGPSAPPSWRFWVEATVGPITPEPYSAEVPGRTPSRPLRPRTHPNGCGSCSTPAPTGWTPPR